VDDTTFNELLASIESADGFAFDNEARMPVITLPVVVGTLVDEDFMGGAL
jgi:hypothetical protein